jgi:leucyl aminopeptidase
VPRDVLLEPLTSDWTVAPGLAAALGGDTGQGVLVAPVGTARGCGEAVARDALTVLGLDADEVLEAHEPATTAGTVTSVPLRPGAHAARRVLLVGTGDGAAEHLRSAGAAVGRATRGAGTVVHALGPAAAGEALTAWVEGGVLGGCAAPRWRAGGPVDGAEPAREVRVVAQDASAPTRVARAVTRARAQLLARGLSLTPSNIKNPAWVARQARTVAARDGLAVRVWDERQLAREGFGGLLAVGSGSATPPRLVRLDHTPPAATSATPHVVLVGKGITFDTGGLQVKPAEGMLGMKTDMSGSAIVLAVLSACADLEVPVRVTGLLALAENAVDGASYRPGDVIRQYGGRTVEIGNTDAEGRIVMADALAYADAQLDPDVLLDVATLTGAARVALARVMAPVFATDDDLASALVAAGEASGETLWRLPLADTYRRALDSDVADLTHIAPSVGGGAVTAALFLREFVGERRWAHLDIAGTGRSDVDAGINAKGGTGFGTRLLLRWLEDMG